MNKSSYIPLVDLELQHKSLRINLTRVIREVFESSSFIKGAFLGGFEKNFAKLIGTKYCVGVASGTDALHLSLLALGIGKDDEVILPVNTFIATAYPILYVGAKPVFVDIDPKTYNIDINSIREKITKKTKAIIPVHIYGQPAQMDKILLLAKQYKLFIIEDACQAHGASFENKKVGSFGDLAAFSFYPSKNLAALGDGGAITTNSKKLYIKLIKLREYGFSSSKYSYNQIGLNSRLDAIQAAILSLKLNYLKQWNKQRIKIANYYDQSLKKSLFIKTPFINKLAKSVYHLYVIETPKRDLLMKHLLTLGIQTDIHYPIPLHLQKSLKFLGYKRGAFPVAEALCKKILSIPIYPQLTLKNQNYILHSIKEFFKK